MDAILEFKSRKMPTDSSPLSRKEIMDDSVGRTKTGPGADLDQKWIRILVAIDFTPASVHALRRAASLAGRFGSTVSPRTRALRKHR